MAIYVIAHTKGGTGKTTLAIQLLLGLFGKGLRVWFVDGDRQQTGMQMLSNRQDLSGLEPAEGAGFPQAAHLRVQVRAQARNYDHVIIDVGQGAPDILAAALSVSDVVIAPVVVGQPSLWALADLQAIVAQAEASRDQPLKCWAVLNMAEARNDHPDNEVARQAVKASEYFDLMKTTIVRRSAIMRASERGLTVPEYTQAKREQPARDEIAAFITEAVRIK